MTDIKLTSSGFVSGIHAVNEIKNFLRVITNSDNCVKNIDHITSVSKPACS